MAYVIGCDLGSQSAKSVLMSESGEVLASASRKYPMTHPHSGWADQDPAEYRTALAYSIQTVISETGINPAEVTHIGLSSQVDGVVPIDANANPLRPAVIWLDRRATTQVDALERAVGADALFAQTGLNLDASHTAPKYMWLRDEEPEIYSAAASLPFRRRLRTRMAYRSSDSRSCQCIIDSYLRCDHS